MASAQQLLMHALPGKAVVEIDTASEVESLSKEGKDDAQGVRFVWAIIVTENDFN